MSGPFQVTIPASTPEGVYYNSLPQRIVRKMNTPRWTDLTDERNTRRDRIVGVSVSAVVVIAFLGYLVWRKWRVRKR